MVIVALKETFLFTAAQPKDVLFVRKQRGERHHGEIVAGGHRAQKSGYGGRESRKDAIIAA